MANETVSIKIAFEVVTALLIERNKENEILTKALNEIRNHTQKNMGTEDRKILSLSTTWRLAEKALEVSRGSYEDEY